MVGYGECFRNTRKGVRVTENVSTPAEFRFHVGVGIGTVVFFLTFIFSLLIDTPLYVPVAIIGCASGLIQTFVKSWPGIVSFSGGHFLIQWVLYSVTKTANWKVSILYALIGTATCLLGQWILTRKKS